MQRSLSFSLTLLCLLLTPGCSLLPFGQPETPLAVVAGQLARAPKVPAVVTSSVLSTWKEKYTRVAPLGVRVAQAFFSEQELVVKVHLESKTELDPKTIAVSVLGLREGEVVEENRKIVSEVTSEKHLAVGSVTAIRFTLSASELTEYQVRCSWGEDVQKFEEKNTTRASLAHSAASVEPPKFSPAELKPPGVIRPSVEERNVYLRGVEVIETAEECVVKPCNFIFHINAEIVNGSNSPVSGVELAVGIYWANKGKLPRLPAASSAKLSNEELVDLSTLELAAGEGKRIRIKLDRSVPKLPGGSFIPHVRVLKN